MAEQDNRGPLISEIRQRFETEYLSAKRNKYDSRDIERLHQDDTWVDNFLIWRDDIVDDTLKMIDESFQWRKEYAVHDLTESSFPKLMLDVGAIYLHGYDKEGYKIFWFRVKLHTKDSKTQFEKKKLVAFWLERYAKKENGKPLTVVFDMADTGLSNIDFDFVRYIISCFKVYYPNFLTAFKIVKNWLGPEAAALLKLTNKNEIQEYITVEYLPPHMGGTDAFKYSYPPLVDDNFQTPLCENGPITSEDEAECKEVDTDNKDNIDTTEEQALNPKKANTSEQTPKSEECDKLDSKTKNAKKALTTFKGSLLHISPAEELHFGSKETAEKKCLIILTNVTKNAVAFKVRTTAPDKYRVKPSNSSCEPGTSIDIAVSLHGGKLRCHVVESSKNSSLIINENAFNSPSKTNEDLHFQLRQLLQANRRLQEQIDRCVWFQQLILFLVFILVIIVCFFLFCAPGS
ncbi:hypothetical protein Chor_000614 [Crotalus horridus]